MRHRHRPLRPHLMSDFGGKADMTRHNVLDQFVLKVQKEHIKTLKGLPRALQQYAPALIETMTSFFRAWFCGTGRCSAR